MRVLMLGALPSHFAPRVRTEAANHRTWQLLAPLLDRHDCCLICADREQPLPRQVPVPHARLQCWVLSFHRHWTRVVHRLATEFQPDVVIGVRYRGAMYAARLGLHLPLWVDSYGDLAVESQGYEHANPKSSGTWSASWIEQVMYEQGDVFSTCCNRQRYAAIGKLGLLRRLTGPSLGYEFVHTIPPGIDTTSTSATSPHDGRRSAVAAIPGLERVPPDAIVALWCGSYNTWTDLDLLFQGVTMAMNREPRLHYVSTGTAAGAHAGHRSFVERVGASSYRPRFHLLEWQPYEVVQRLQAVADIGLSIDAAHYEVLLGTRTRLIEMAAHGLALVSTSGTELAESLAEEGALWLLDQRSPAALADALVVLARDAERRKALAHRAQQIAARDYSFVRTTLPLQQWVEAPTFAPDKSAQTFSTRAYRRSRLAMRRMAWSAIGALD